MTTERDLSDAIQPQQAEVVATPTGQEDKAIEQTPQITEESGQEEISAEQSPVQEPVDQSGETSLSPSEVQEQDVTAYEVPAGDDHQDINYPATEGEPEASTASADDASVAEPQVGDVQEQSTPAEESIPEPEVTATHADTKADQPAPADSAAGGQPVDFFEEEAMLAAQAPEFDLGENEDEAESEGSAAANSSQLPEMTKEQILDHFAELLSSKPVQTLRKDVDAIKIAFYKLHRAEEDARRRAYMDSGADPEAYQPDSDPSEQRLKDLFAEYRRRRDEFLDNLERSRDENLKTKLAIIEELRELVNGNETMNSTFNSFRELQQRWRDAGPVPQAHVKDIWETYNYHVENFYSYIKINKELRDLDLKKNYEAKLALCEEAEALILDPSVVNSFHRLQKLHDQWRETGPVANEYKESLWERFREASTRINKQHQDYFEGLKEEQKANLDLKTELCVKTEELSEGVFTTRKEWNKASDRLLEIQKVWKTIGFAPKKDNAKIYERFRNACDRFFENKRNFYSQLKTEMDLNLQLKNEICEAAEALQNSEDWKKTTDELIGLQKKWKEIGPVSRRHSDAVWKRFRTACDKFFERKAGHYSSKDSEHEENLRLKRALLDEIEQCDVNEGGFEAIKEYQRRWSEIGFVPIKEKDAIQARYKEIMDKLFSTLRGNEQGRQMDRFRGRVQNMKNSGDRRLRTERDRLYNKVRQLESDIALLENNIGFFAKSKNAESMIRDVREKIEKAKQEMAATIEKINLIDSEQ